MRLPRLRATIGFGAALLALAVFPLHADEEQNLISALQSGTASAPEKCSACQHLRIVGTAKAVPAIAPLLEEERTSQAARYALEGMPCPEAVTALRKALPKTSGLIKAGIIDSLGWRHDSKAVPLLTKALSDANTAVASAAATALGRIGDKAAIKALLAARLTVVPALLPALFDGLARNAGQVRASGYPPGFGDGCPEPVLVAAFRDWMLADRHARTSGPLMDALAGPGLLLHKPALQVLRELNDESVIKAAYAKWADLPADAQLAVLDSRVKLGGADVLATARRAAQSAFPSVRIAAYDALADLGDPESISTLTKAAATAPAAERDAAREALIRLHGPRVDQALLNQLASAGSPEKIELLRAAGERLQSGSTEVLLQTAKVETGPVRLAALDALRKIALPATLAPLLEIAGQSLSDTERELLLQALSAACQAGGDKEQASRVVLTAFNDFGPGLRARFFPLLAELATPGCLAEAAAGARDSDAELSMEAVRTLSRWPDAAAGRPLLELARTGSNPTLQTLALRGCITVAGFEPDPSKRLDLLVQAIAAARRPEEKKQALAQLAHLPTQEALKKTMDFLSDPDLANEAGLAALTIAEPLSKTNPDLAKETASQVLARCNTPEITRRALAIRGKPTARSGPFLIDWVVSGPYSQPGVTGAVAIFDIAFAPEKPGGAVQWKPFPRGKIADLLSFFPDQANCAAYLKTGIISPKDCDATLLLGSDDGVKAWLNGTVVHANNIDRGLTADEDTAPIHLKKGANDLMLKITQGGGGWAACARIVGPDGKPIKGLKARAEP